MGSSRPCATAFPRKSEVVWETMVFLGSKVHGRSGRPRVQAVAGLLLVAVAMLGGCRRTAVVTEPPAAEPPGARSARDVKLPVVTQTLGEVRAEMARFDKWSPEFEKCRLKMAILQDARRKENGVEGYDQRESWAAFYNNPTFAADRATGRISWRALTCLNPACRAVGRGGGPFLFTREYSWVTAGRDGQTHIGTWNEEEARRPIVCPACGLQDYVRQYDLPQTLVRERELMDELQRSNNAIAEAMLKKRPPPTGIRKPKEITAEIESLPRLYLLSEPGKTKRFEGVVGPARTTPDGTP